MRQGRPRLAGCVIACYLMAACAVGVLEELMAEVATAAQIPAWLTARFEATVGHADPPERPAA